MKKAIQKLFLLFVILIHCSIVSAQLKNCTSAQNDNEHASPVLLSSGIYENRANFYMNSDGNAVYDIIVCKNIYTNDEKKITQSSSPTIILNNLEQNSYYEISVKRRFKDGLLSKELSFCFSTTQMSDISGSRDITDFINKKAINN